MNVNVDVMIDTPFSMLVVCKNSRSLYENSSTAELLNNQNNAIGSGLFELLKLHMNSPSTLAEIDKTLGWIESSKYKERVCS